MRKLQGIPPFFCTLPLTSFYDNERFRKSWATNFRGIWPSMIICLNHIWSYVAISQRPNLLWYNLSRALSKFLIEIRIFIYQLFWYMASSQKKVIKSLWKRITSYWSWFSGCQHAYVIFVNFVAPPPYLPYISSIALQKKIKVRGITWSGAIHVWIESLEK